MFIETFSFTISKQESLPCLSICAEISVKHKNKKEPTKNNNFSFFIKTRGRGRGRVRGRGRGRVGIFWHFLPKQQ